MFSKITAAAPPTGASMKLSELTRLTDGQLLARFFQNRDDSAFTVIIDRYGPLVYGVCRRVLADSNDAEDAFQATFLVLVRKGATLRDPGRLANWLYGVAQRTARKARAKAALRTKSERQAGEMPTKSDRTDLTYNELQAVLDEEIAQLPEKYALPLVLCYLEGKTNAEAAKQLGWPEGSISRRLSRARELLRSRLARRGLALSAALITAVFARPSSAAVPGELLSATSRAAALMADGVDVADVVSPSAASLVRDVLTGMSATSKFAIPTAVALALLLMFTSAAVWQLGGPAQAASLLHRPRASTAHALQTTTGSMPTSKVSPAAATGEAGACSTPAPAPVAASCSAPPAVP
jgi:RNA polymerase sigma factor (sigma-70 family)